MAYKQMYGAIENSPVTKLASNINSSVTSITVVEAWKLPIGPNICTIGIDDTAETIYYLSKSGNTLNGVVRGFQGTARSWDAGTSVARNFTEYDYRSLVDNTTKLIEDTEKLTNKDGAYGYSGLDSRGRVPLSNLYGDIVEYYLGDLSISNETFDNIYYDASNTNIVLPEVWDAIRISFRPEYTQINTGYKRVFLRGLFNAGEDIEILRNAKTPGIEAYAVCTCVIQAEYPSYGAVIPGSIVEAPSTPDGSLTINGKGYLIYNDLELRTLLDKKQDLWKVGTSTQDSTGEAYVATLINPPLSYYVGMLVTIIPSITSTSIAPTINFNGKGVKTICRRSSSNASEKHTGSHPGWLVANRPYRLMYDGTNFVVIDSPKTNYSDLEDKPDLSNYDTAVIGAASGQTITLSDVQPNTNVRSLKINGETMEIGEGDKSPDNPYELVGVENPTITVSDGTNSVDYPITTIPLYSLPSGIRDYIEIDDTTKTAKLIRNVGRVVLSGSESWQVSTSYTNFDRFTTSFVDKTNGGGLCSHFGTTSNLDDNPSNVNKINIFVSTLNIFIMALKGAYTVETFETWLSHNPVTVLYILAAPVITELDYEAVRTYSPTTIISTNGGSLEVKYNRDMHIILDDIDQQITESTPDTMYDIDGFKAVGVTLGKEDEGIIQTPANSEEATHMLVSGEDGPSFMPVGYGKQETRQTFANAIIGTASGETVTLTDVQEGTEARSLKVKGETTEIGEGEKSPDNPYELAGVESAVVTVSGKNRWGGELENGYIDPATGINQSWGGYKRSGYIPMPSNTGYVFACNKPETGAFFAIYYDKNKNYISSHNLVISTSPIKRTTPLGTAYIRITGVVAIMDNLGDKAQLELGTTATPYEPYKPITDYPTTTPTLYSLPNSVADEVDIVSGAGSNAVGVKVFDGTEPWKKIQGALTTATTYRLNRSYLGMQEGFNLTSLLCTHYPYKIDIFSDSDINKINTAQTADVLAVCVNLSEFPDVAAWKAYLAAQHAAGTPIKVLYKLATPSPTQLTPLKIPTYPPTTIISVDKGSLNVEYNRDINKVLADMQQQNTLLTNTIIALVGTIDV